MHFKPAGLEHAGKALGHLAAAGIAGAEKEQFGHGARRISINCYKRYALAIPLHRASLRSRPLEASILHMTFLLVRGCSIWCKWHAMYH